MARYIFGGSPADIVFAALTNDKILRVAAETTVTVWDAATGGNQLTDLQLPGNGTTITALTTDGNGRLPRFMGPDSLAELWIDSGANDRWILTSTQLGSLLNDKLDKDGVPGPHTHAMGDVSGLQRLIDQALRVIRFDTASNTWPNQPDITPTYPTVPVFWKGHASIPSQARAGDYIDQLGTPYVSPDPTPEPDPDPDPITGISTTEPVVNANGAIVHVTASLTTEDSRDFAYIQIAVRSPSGANFDQDFNRNVTVDGTLDLDATFTANMTGTTWSAWVAYKLTETSVWVDGPKKTFTVTLPNTSPTPGPGHDINTPTGRVVPYQGLSALGWNSGSFVHDQWSKTATAAFGTYRGKTNDCKLVFGIHDGSWEQLITVWDDWAGFNGITIISVGPQPQPQTNAATAAGTNNHYWETFGQRLAAKGMNTNKTIIRCGWECNGNWYAWSHAKAGGAAAYVAAYKNVVTSVRRYAPNVLFDLNFNKDYPTQGGMTWQAVADALHGYIDILSLDAYDMWDGWRNDSSRMNTWMNKAGAQRNSVLAYSRANNIPLGFPEWALVALAGASGTGGGDDLLYMQKTKEYFTLLANEGRLAYECYYNDGGAPADLLHELFRYPTSETYYRSTAGWGNH